jgi:hypothetical protein
MGAKRQIQLICHAIVTAAMAVVVQTAHGGAKSPTAWAPRNRMAMAVVKTTI